MSQFHNPYHFVPLPDAPPAATASLAEFEAPKRGQAPKPRRHPHLTHDRFVAGTHSGRIECRITVETPLICANEQEDQPGACKRLRPFSLDDGATPAIPGAGLRGMLSSLIEAASGSALRVLSDTALSHRMAVAKESLSAIGLLVNARDKAGDTILAMRPLTVPTVDRTPPRGATEGADEFPVRYQRFFQPNFKQPLLKGYVNGYRKRGQSLVELDRVSFLGRTDPDSRSADKAEFWYAQLGGNVNLAGTTVSATNGVRDNRSNRFLLAQRITGDPISQAEFDALPPADQDRYTRGFLRILGIEGRESEIPTTKKHEYFIPYPVGCEKTIPAFDVTAAVERFHRLADQRTDTDPDLPFAVKGSRRNGDPGPRNRKLRLRAGDLVYFKPNEAGTAIEQVSVSSIWRAGNGSVHEYFAELSPDLLPLAPGRETLTLADQLLGAVEVRDAKQQKALKDTPAFALASRLRFHHARLECSPEGGAWQHEEDGLLSDDQLQAKTRHGLERYPLKNLASPKPPSPSLYFKPKTGNGGRGGYVPKGKLTPRAHAPQGRKFYLRRDAESYDASAEAFVHPGRFPEDLATFAKQHQSVEKFVRRSTTFRFEIDFTNLSDLELQLLVYALEPSASYRHQIGHGKPLGLGQARLEIAAIRTVARRQRYADDPLGDPRWHQEHAETEEGDRSALSLSAEIERLRGAFREWAEANRLGPILKAIERIGTPLAAGAKIHYPQAAEVNRGTSREPRWETIRASTADFEREHYHWFVQNDDTAGHRQPGQFLAPLVDARGQVAEALPQLDRGRRDDPPATGYAGPVLPPVPPGGPAPVDGGGGGGGAPNPVGPPAQEGRAPGATLSSPRDLVGKAVKATVERYDTKKGKTRIRFRVEGAGHEIYGYLEKPDPNRDRTTYPEGDGELHDFILLNPQKVGTAWQCDLRKP